MASRKLSVAYVKTASLQPDKKNPKVHPPEQITALAAAITEFGFTQPILTHGKTIVAGEGRWLAAKRAKLAEVPIIALDGLGDEGRRLALLVADNKLPTMGRWDQKKLDRVLKLVAKSGAEISITGFTDEDYARLTDDLAEDVMREVSDTSPRSGRVSRTSYEAEDEPDPEQMVTIAVVVTPDQRDLIMEVLNEVRESGRNKKWKLGDALHYVCQLWRKKR